MNPSSPSTRCEGVEPPIEPRPVTRLTNEELRRSTIELFALPTSFAPASPLPAPTAEVSTFVKGLSFPALPPGAQDGIFESLLAYANQVSAAFSETAYNRAFASQAGCRIDQQSNLACIESHVQGLIDRAFRGQSVDEDTVDFLLSVFEDFSAEMGPSEAFVQAATKFVLLHPAFLFKTYRGGDGETEARPLSNQELATRVSFLLWGIGPDQERLALDWDYLLRNRSAEAAEDLEEVLIQMIEDPRSDYFLRSFSFQWLNTNMEITSILGDVDSLDSPDPLQAALDGELIAMIRHLILQKAPLEQLLTADYTYLNKTLAELYGIDPAGFTQVFEKVSFSDYPELYNRKGILTQAKLLSSGSMPSRPSAAHRGTRILRSVLCSEMGDPIGFVLDQNDGGGVDPETISEADRFRRLTEADTANCAGCHLKINPLGFSFHTFDRLGRHDLELTESGSMPEPAIYENVAIRGQSTNNPSPIWKDRLNYLHNRGGQLDALPSPAGPISGGFQDHMELIELIASSGAFTHCITEHLYDYTSGYPSKSAFSREQDTIEAHACTKYQIQNRTPNLLSLLANTIARPGMTEVRRD